MMLRKILPFVTLFLIAYFVTASVLDSTPWVDWPAIKKFEGKGPVIDDLERHSDSKHLMRNDKDHGNWAHELTHHVNSMIRVKTSRARGEAWNGFYVLNGKAIIFKEPNITLAQVAKEIPKDQRGEVYQLYLVEQRRYWNNEPLYVLDEAVAYANGLEHHIRSKTDDDFRRDRALEFLNYCDALVRAVERHDPDYNITSLRAFVNWHRNRVNRLVSEYNGDTEIPDYNL